MPSKDKRQVGNLLLSTRLMAVVVLILIVLVAGSSLAFAQENRASVRQVQAIEVEKLGLANPAGLAYSPAANSLLVVETPLLGGFSAPFSGIAAIAPLEDQAHIVYLLLKIVDPLNMAFDGQANRLLLYQSATRELIEVGAGPDGHLNPAMVTRHDAREFGLERPQGMAVDPASGQVYFLDSAGPRIVSVEPDVLGDFGEAKVREVDLDQMGAVGLLGLALDPTTGHLYVLAPVEQMLYEVTVVGEIVASRDLSAFALGNPQGMVFAPSGDLTDDPSEMSLYIADSGSSAGLEGQTTSQSSGEIVELSFDEIEPQAETIGATLVQVIDTSLFDPPSPDPAGITYLEFPGTLLMSDSEVNEMDPPIWQGSNLFEISLEGDLESTSTTTGFSNEPTGVAYDPAGNGRVFISSDDGNEIYIVDLGADGEYDPGDPMTHFDTAAFGSDDAEGVAYDTWDDVLFIVDGVNTEVYRVDPGSNGVFDGVPATEGDDVVTSWDTEFLVDLEGEEGPGITDPEGVAFDPENGYLYIVGNPDEQVAHVTTSGILVRWIDISAANPRRPAGLACAPGSEDPSAMSIYVTDRGTDNNSNPTENDGKVYELYVPALAPDVAIAKTVDPASASGGDPIEFTLTFSNTGGDVATDVEITDIIPLSVTVQSWSSSGAQVTGTQADPPYIWAVEDLAAGEGGVITINGELSPTLLCGDSFLNTASISTTADDSRPGNNSSEVWVSVGVGVSVDPPADSATADPGDPVIYTLEVTNDGECPDTFTITVNGASWSVSAPASTEELGPGQSTDVDVTVTVPGGAQGGEQDVATITFTSGLDDVTSASSELTTSVTAYPGVSLIPSTGGVPADPGTEVGYQLYVRNDGNGPDTYTLTVEGNSWPTEVAPAVVEDVAPGASAPVDVTVSVPSSAQCGDDVVTVIATSQSDPGISDSSILTTTANAVYEVTVTPSSDDDSGDQGDPVVYNLRVTNTGNCTDTFSVGTGSGSWITEAPATVGPLAPDAFEDIAVTATVPAEAQCTDVDTAIVTFTSLEDAGAYDSSQLTTSTNAFYGFALEPASMALSGDPGTGVLYTFQVTNLGNCGDYYAVGVAGESWSTEAPTPIGEVAPGEEADVEVTVTVPGNAGCGEQDTAVITLTSLGDGTQTHSSNITTSAETVRGVTVTPSTASAAADPTYDVVYSLRVQNSGNCSDIFDLDVNGTTWPVEIQPTYVSLAAGASADVDVTVTVPEDALCGDDVATVTATSRNDGSASDASVLTTTANAVYGVTVTPPSASGSGEPTEEVVYELRVTNSGNCPTRYDIAVTDNNWLTEVRSTVGPLEPGAGRNRDVTVTVPQDALCGEADSATVTVTSQDDGSVSDSSVLSTSAEAVYGVTVTPSSHSASADPGSDAIHTLRVTNDGNCQDTFDIDVSGNLWPTQAPATVGPLAPDAGADVDVTVDVLLCKAGGESDTATATSTSQHDGTESDSATLVTTANQVAPVANDDEYSTDEDTALEVEAPGLLGNDSDANCDDKTVAWINQPDNGIVTDYSAMNGSFRYIPDPNFNGDDSFTYAASDGHLTDMATVVIHVLAAGDDPIVDAGEDQSADEGEEVHFDGDFVDPARTLTAGETVHWDFGDGETTTGTLTPSHAYNDNGEYTVTLTITDGNGDVGYDSLLVTVDNVAPTVDAGPDQKAQPGELISFSGDFTDPGADDTWTIEWDLGDGTFINDTTAFDYAYDDPGIYTVTLTVTDDDGGVGDDTVEIRVMLRVYLPVISRASQR
jgi:uncharacterized repeat protein (TIGR01451 family)